MNATHTTETLAAAGYTTGNHPLFGPFIVDGPTCGHCSQIIGPDEDRVTDDDGHPTAHKRCADAAKPEADFWADADIIHTYTRAQALADGALVAVDDKTASEAGFRIPVALTRAAWEDCVTWTDEDEKRKRALQDEAGRLWDVLWMASLAARRHRGIDRIAFQVLRVPRDGRGVKPRLAHLILHIGPGDTAEPVVTIMTPLDA